MTRARASTLWRTQNVLRDPLLAERLVRRSGIGPRDVVYDLGAGTGVLTAALAARAGRVVAVETDPELAERLRARFQAHTNVVIRRADIRTYPLPHADYVVFASPPFDITAAIIRKLTDWPVPPRDAWLVLQREAAERYGGSPDQTLAALRIAPWFSVEVLRRFRRTDFAPPPAVDVVFVRVHKRGPPLVPGRDARLYRDFVAAIFTAWRPSVGHSLSDAIGARSATRLLAAAGIAPASRPSTISLQGWLSLYERFSQLPEPLRGRVAGAELRLQRRQRRLVKRHRSRAPRDGLPAAFIARHATGPPLSPVAVPVDLHRQSAS
jgi:16S rRNA A1518/A1519 N6-dimethyltransferase RsmA/KsgA/DIM1 with predicted DNA glycosylase/AP lyase activity